MQNSSSHEGRWSDLYPVLKYLEGASVLVKDIRKSNFESPELGKIYKDQEGQFYLKCDKVGKKILFNSEDGCGAFRFKYFEPVRDRSKAEKATSLKKSDKKHDRYHHPWVKHLHTPRSPF